MNIIESAYEAGASIESLVLACCEAVKSTEYLGDSPDAVEGVAAAEAWAKGEATIEDVDHWKVKLNKGWRFADMAAYWLLSAIRRHAIDQRTAWAVDNLQDCIEYVVDCYGGDRATVELILSAALEPRDTIPCPPSTECVEHAAIEQGRAA